jgi:hypothetical protein
MHFVLSEEQKKLQTVGLSVLCGKQSIRSERILLGGGRQGTHCVDANKLAWCCYRG